MCRVNITYTKQQRMEIRNLKTLFILYCTHDSIRVFWKIDLGMAKILWEFFTYIKIDSSRENLTKY